MFIARARPDLLDPDISTFAIVVVAIVLVALWAGAHWLKRYAHTRWSRIAFFGSRVAMGTVALWASSQVIARFFSLTTSWVIWIPAVLAAICMELVISLYALERAVVSRRDGKLMLALRVGAVTALFLMLLQPVLSWDSEREFEREIVVLIDDSESMQLVDEQLDPSEKLKVASLFKVGVAKQRFRLEESQLALEKLLQEARTEMAAFFVEEDAGERLRNAVLKRRAEPLKKFLAQCEVVMREARSNFISAQRTAKRMDGVSRGLVEEVLKKMRNEASRTLASAQRDLAAPNHAATQRDLLRFVQSLEAIVELVPRAVASADKSFYESLSSSEKAAINKAAGRPRLDIAREALRAEGKRGSGLIEGLKENFNVRFVRFASKAAAVDGEAWLEDGTWDKIKDSGFRSLTNLSEGLDFALKDVPAESLAGLLVVTDGRHNAEAQIEDVARRLGIQRSPICSVIVGSRVGPRDAGFIDVKAPQSIYLGDKVRVNADLRIDGLRGEKVRVGLYQDDREIQSEIIKVPEDAYRPSVHFRHLPTEKGTYTYQLKIDPIKGEKFPDDNVWEFETAVSDDRINVLLVDDRPRWEFRYLRNLFYGRDKSIHLQYVLLTPDRIEGLPADESIMASAARPFGESRATELPESREDWMQFDAIILGDVPPDAISQTAWGHIEACVKERASMLVCIAGPQFMPHAIDNPKFLEMSPVLFEQTQAEYHAAPELEYRIGLTAEGRRSSIMRQSSSDLVNDQIWAQMPPLRWRHPVVDVKTGAEVLAYAVLRDREDDLNSFNSVEEALARQEGRRDFERKHPLVTVWRHGIGKVAMLTFDRTWRFRYGVGDVYHHRFWGKMMRWGVGESLRAGTRNVRLGTDLLSYTPDEPIRMMAKVIDENHRPVTSEELVAHVSNSDDDEIARVTLKYREGSNGMYEAQLQPIAGPGRFRLRLEGNRIDTLLQLEGVEKLSTYFNVLEHRNPIELAELTVDRSYVSTAAALSDGTIVEPDAAPELIDFFNTDSTTVVEPKKTSLWDSLPLFLLLVALVSTEWILRRRGGLA